MPFINAAPDLKERTVLQNEIEPDVAAVDTVQAAFSLHNSLGSLVDRGVVPKFELNPLSPELNIVNGEYDPYENDINGYEQYANRFTDSISAAETEYIKSNIDREKGHRQTLEDSGFMGLTASFAAGMTEPTMLPLFFMGGGVINGTRSATVAGLEIGASVGTGVAISEMALHATQETRTLEESAINITAATLLSGVIGGAITRMTKSEIAQVTKAINDDLQPATPTSAGAAAVRSTTMEQETLIKAAGLEKVGMTPDTRLSNSPSLTARQIKDDLIESSLRKEKNIEGIPTGPEGGTVETRIKQYDRVIGEAISDIDDAYLMYRQGQTGISASLKTKAGDLFGARNRSGQLSAKEFREELGRALVRNDAHAIKEIDTLAKRIRSKVIDPIKEKAISLKLLPEDVKTVTAPSYLTRVWKPEIVAAKKQQLNDTIANWMVKENPELDVLEANSFANDIIDNILGHPEGKIPFEVVGKAGPLHERVLLIPDTLIEEYLEKDADVVLRYYVRTMAPDIEITERFGTKDMSSQFADIRTEYGNKISNLKGKNITKKTEKLNAKMEQDLEDLAALRDMLSGVYGRPANPSDTFYRASSSIRKINFLSKLGGMTMSALPDMANHVFAHGLKPVAKALVQLISTPKKFKVAAQQVKETGAAWDMVLNTRAQTLAEIGDSLGRHSVFERVLQAETNRFGLLSLMAPWNAAQKQFAGIVSSNEVINVAAKIAEGAKLGRHDTLMMASSGISKDMAKRISKQFAKFGEREKSGLRLANANKWEDTEAAQVFRASILKQVDEIIVTPGKGDRPLWMDKYGEAGRHIGQFKSFMFAATNKISIARMQQRDAEALNGLMLSVALGALTYASKQTVAGRPVSSDPAIVIKEAIDRAGITGFVMDGNNIIEKVSEGRLGISSMLGMPQASRYASRNKAGAFLGPSFGTVSDILDVMGAAGSGEFDEKNVHALRKIMPYQNLFYIRNLLNNIEEEL